MFLNNFAEKGNEALKAITFANRVIAKFKFHLNILPWNYSFFCTITRVFSYIYKLIHYKESKYVYFNKLIPSPNIFSLQKEKNLE